MRRLPGYGATAVSTLSQAPERARSDLLRLLAAEPDLVARRLEAELRASWGDPLGGVRVLTPALPSDRVQAIAALRSLLDQLRTLGSPEAKQAQGQVLEALASRSPNEPAARLRLEAAQAYSAAGDRTAARRMLSGLANDRGCAGVNLLGRCHDLARCPHWRRQVGRGAEAAGRAACLDAG